jgi:hypothetical protein
MRVAADLQRDLAAERAEPGEIGALGGFGQFPPDMELGRALGRAPAALDDQCWSRARFRSSRAATSNLRASLATRTEIALRDFEKGILVAPSDVGVGISQMVPVIVASLRKQDGVLGIEQPELHVHHSISDENHAPHSTGA